MNPSVTVLSSQEITLEELKDVLLKAGGIYDPGGGMFGLILQEERYIWIHTGASSLREFLADYLDVLEQDVPDILEQIQTKLGGEPRAYFELEIRRTPGSQRLAVEFANLCAETWPCVVVCSRPRYIFSKEEIQQLLREGKGFHLEEI
jgi:hypothetical protein